MSKRAIILFNLGGPDKPEAVEPFLFNLFNDPAIIGAPGPIRYLIARLISRRRAPIAQEIYANLGGGSPLLPNTQAQARALEMALTQPGEETRCFIAMRYWHPRADDVAREVAAWKPDRVVLVPLYPQYSKTTSGSSLKEWQKAAEAAGLTAPVSTLCCWPEEPGFISAAAALVRETYAGALAHGTPRVLFSAHGLPKKVIRSGDPYQFQVEKSAAAVVEALGIPQLDWLVSYQSRVGPLEWIGPATDDEIRRAGQDKVPLIVCPIAFVSDHSETLVELDIEYKHLADESGVPAYFRVPVVATHPAFIDGLARAIALKDRQGGLSCAGGGRLCPAAFGQCPARA
ncbi:ferrochelatase [Elstera cyanobacteriorum]|uniref:Ferrochelatase n=1 Tax=Elstera cyanobacteriorum TaxID=2022747 RepID=A0A255XUR5_9PROT|nr:ferrochelatase [Elstera cyanobacteriorum]OYQ20641.1 ferrochelatase [Elstera cyanobacteriorum]GFZ99984.1 ferrochelatase [Elstera cyanobacteriorum]